MTQHPGAMDPPTDQPPTSHAPRWVLAAVLLLALSSWYTLRGLLFMVGPVVYPLAEGVVPGTAVLRLLEGLTVGGMPGLATLLAGAAMMRSPQFAQIAGIVGLVQTAGALTVLTMMAIDGVGIMVIAGAVTAILLLPAAAMVLVQGRSDEPAESSGLPLLAAGLAVFSAVTLQLAPVALALSETMDFLPVRAVLTALLASLLTALPALAAACVASASTSARWAGVALSVVSSIFAAVHTLSTLATLGSMSQTPPAFDVVFMTLTPVTLGAAAVCGVVAARAQNAAATT